MDSKVHELSDIKVPNSQSVPKAKKSQEQRKDQMKSNDSAWAASPQQEEKIKCRSMKKKVNSYEIRFQQNFLHEHQYSLLKITQKYIESCLKQNNQTTLSFGFSSLFGTLSEIKPHPKLNIQGNNFFGKLEKEQYKKDLVPEDKLTQFLELLQTQFSSQVSEQFLFISYLVWEKYLQIRKPLLKQKDFRDIAQSFANSMLDKIFFHEKIQFVNLKKVQSELKKGESEIKQSFKFLLNCFSETIFLIIEGYFQNPYYDGSEKLDAYSDEELRSDQNFFFSSQDNSISCQKQIKIRKCF